MEWCMVCLGVLVVFDVTRRLSKIFRRSVNTHASVPRVVFPTVWVVIRQRGRASECVELAHENVWIIWRRCLHFRLDSGRGSVQCGSEDTRIQTIFMDVETEAEYQQYALVCTASPTRRDRILRPYGS